MQVLPHVTSMKSSIITRSGDSTGGDAGPACLRLWEHCSPSERGPLFAAPQPVVPPCAEPTDTHQAKSMSQNNSPHVPSQGSFETCAVAKAIVPRCPSSPPQKEKGSVSAGLLFLPHRDSGQCVTPPDNNQCSTSISEHHGKGWSFSAQQDPKPHHWCCASGVGSLPGTLLAPLMPARPTLHHGPVSGRGNSMAGSPGGEKDPRTATA